MVRIILTTLLSLFVVVTPVVAEEPVPEGFELQILEGTKGEIAKPKSWFYQSSANDECILWTLSKEDPSKGSYRTGMHIQFCLLVSKMTKTSPEELIRRFVEEKRNSAQIDRECEEVSAGRFKRICLETTEPSSGPVERFKILYTYSWSNDMDAIAVTTFGAPEGDWPQLAETIAVMSQLVLIGE